jgi:hypothetical protein
MLGEHRQQGFALGREVVAVGDVLAGEGEQVGRARSSAQAATLSRGRHSWRARAVSHSGSSRVR